MDLEDIRQTAHTVEILHPATAEPIGIVVTLLSINDPKLKAVKKRIIDAKLKLEQRGKTFKADEYENNLNELYFTTIVSWDWGEVTWKGAKNPEMTRKNVMEVFAAKEWFRDQIKEAVEDEKNFFQN